MTQAWKLRLAAVVITAISLVLCVASPAIAQSNYRFVQISPGLTPAYDINDDGVVVGFYLFGDANGNLGYKWTEDTGHVPLVSNPADISKFPFAGANALAINNGGTVVGQGAQSGSAPPFVPTVLSAAGTLTFLPPSETPSVVATARGVNNGGAVVGKWRGNGQTAFYWSAATGIEAITPSPSDVFYARDAFDVNDAGVVVGWCTGTECGLNGAYLWSRTAGHYVMPKVAAFPTAHHEGLAINERLQVVGRYIGAGGAAGIFFWSAATGTVDLDAPAGQPVYVDINDRAEIVATITPPEGGTVPYLLRNGIWTDLNTLMEPDATFHLDTVRAINNNGWIVGEGQAPLQAGYVLIPPTVDVTANGADGPLALGPGDPIQISLAFEAGNGGQLNPAELYVALSSPFGVYWLTPSGFVTTPTRLYAGPIPSFAPALLFNIPAAGSLPAGNYAWIAVVDNDTNGVVNAHFFDYVVTTITP